MFQADASSVHWAQFGLSLISLGVMIGVMKANAATLKEGQRTVIEKLDRATTQGLETKTKLLGFIELEEERHEKLDIAVDELKGDVKRLERSPHGRS